MFKLKPFFIASLALWLCCSIIYRCNLPKQETKSEAYWRGYSDGYGKALDTINEVLIRKMNNDSILELSTVNDKDWLGKDTFRVFLTNRSRSVYSTKY